MSLITKSLGELCQIEKGKIGIQKAIPGKFPLVVTAEERLTCDEYHFEGNAVIIPLVSSTGHGHKSLKRIHFQSGKFAVGNILCAVIPEDESILKAEYLYHYLNLNKERELVGRMKGMANVTLPLKEIAKIEIPVLPIEEQMKFVKNYGILGIKKEEISTELTHQLDLVKQMRQAFLREAMQGKLTAAWRAENPETEPASQLLARIKAEKGKLVKEGKLKKQKSLPPIKEEEIPFEIPEGWEWCRLGSIVEMKRGRFSIRPRNDPRYFKGSYLFLQIGSLDEKGSTIMDAPQTLNEKGLSVSKLFPKNTIAIAIVGGTIGNLGVLGKDMCFTDSIIGFFPYSHWYNQKFLLNFLRFKQPEIKFASYQMAGQPNIKIPTLSELYFPLPPLAEQQLIDTKLDELMHLCDQLEASIKASQQQNELLLQQVLREALSG
jgi:type I restriction enzyme S subunit